MDRYSSPASHKVSVTQQRFIKFVGLLVLLVIVSFFFTVPPSYSETPQPDVSQLSVPRNFEEVETETSTVTQQDSSSFETRPSTTTTSEDIELEEKENSTWIDEVRLADNDTEIFENATSCQIEDWNNVTLETVPREEIHRQWIEDEMFILPNDSSFSNAPLIIGAFAFHDHISVTLNNGNLLNTSVFCRYYDCHKKEMVRQMPSFIFPESTVYCPRRAGAKYISVTERIEERARDSVPIITRFTPQHFLTVCASLNETEPMRIVEFIEYYKLQGAGFFHFYVRNSTNDNRRILDDYVRTGDIQVIVLGGDVEKKTETNDCHHRNKYFSKWTAILELDDRLERTKTEERIVDYLDTITDANINALRWNSDNHTRFIIRPERVVSMSEKPLMMYVGKPEIDVDDGFLRKNFESTENTRQNLAQNVPMGVPFRKKLIENTLNRLKWVYNPEDVNCEKKQEASLKYGRNSTCSTTN